MNTYDKWMEKTIEDTTGEHIGEVENLYVDTVTKKPTWLHLETGFFGTKYTYIPVQSVYAAETNDKIVSEYDADFVKGAPHFEEDQVLSDSEERKLYEYYSINYDTGMPINATDVDTDTTTTTNDEIVRAEEEVSVGTKEVERGTVRLHKYVVTEDVDLTVPVRKEKVRVVREPANGEVSPADLGNTVEEVTVTEEVPVVDKKVVAKEKIHLEKDVEVKDAHVNETVRKEEVVVEDDVDRV